MSPQAPDCLMGLADLIAPYRILSFVKVYSLLFQTLLWNTFNFDKLFKTCPPASSVHQSVIILNKVYLSRQEETFQNYDVKINIFHYPYHQVGYHINRQQ